MVMATKMASRLACEWAMVVAVSLLGWMVVTMADYWATRLVVGQPGGW